MATRKRQRVDQKKESRQGLGWGIAGLLVLLVGSASIVFPGQANAGIAAINQVTGIGFPSIPTIPFHLGLDLQGGASLQYDADVSAVAEGERQGAVEGARDVIERRVNAIGVGEPSVRTARVGDDYRINVELPGVEDIDQAITMIGETPTLAFKVLNDEPPRGLTDEEREEIETTNAAAAVTARERNERVVREGIESVAQDVSDDNASKNNGGYLGFVGPADVETAVYDWAATHATGAVTQRAVEGDEAWYSIKRGGEQDGEMQVTASHILICHSGVAGCTSGLTREEAQVEAQRIFEDATAANFADLATEYSSDTGSANIGGALGTFGRGVMVPEFETAVFDAAAGSIIGPVETDFGFHIIYKEDEAVLQQYELWIVQTDKLTAADILPPADEWKNTELSGKQLQRAEVVTDPTSGVVQVSLNFDPEGADLFQQITEQYIGQPVGIFLDGQPISVPTVQAVIANGEAVISGDFTLEEARLLSQRLNAGALPVPVELISQQRIGASLGEASLQDSLRAGAIALLLVMLFMVLYYRLPGILSVIALTMYMTITLTIFKIIGVTLSLAGIAGLILSIGMAVDANVLIFERLKEELKKGRSLRVAVEEGFLRAWTSIRDGNISTLITCVLLLWFGTSFVQGFAITLALGVLVSMFSAIVVTRVLLRFVITWMPKEGSRLFLGYTKKQN